MTIAKAKATLDHLPSNSVGHSVTRSARLAADVAARHAARVPSGSRSSDGTACEEVKGLAAVVRDRWALAQVKGLPGVTSPRLAARVLGKAIGTSSGGTTTEPAFGGKMRPAMVKCKECGRKVFSRADGTPRAHKTSDGTACDGAGMTAAAKMLDPIAGLLGVEVKAGAFHEAEGDLHKGWEATKHPRDKNGRFATLGSHVQGTTSEGKRVEGEVVDSTKTSLTLRQHNGSTVKVPAKTSEVTRSTARATHTDLRHGDLKAGDRVLDREGYGKHPRGESRHVSLVHDRGDGTAIVHYQDGRTSVADNRSRFDVQREPDSEPADKWDSHSADRSQARHSAVQEAASHKIGRTGDAEDAELRQGRSSDYSDTRAKADALAAKSKDHAYGMAIAAGAHGDSANAKELDELLAPPKPSASQADKDAHARTVEGYEQGRRLMGPNLAVGTDHPLRGKAGGRELDPSKDLPAWDGLSKPTFTEEQTRNMTPEQLHAASTRARQWDDAHGDHGMSSEPTDGDRDAMEMAADDKRVNDNALAGGDERLGLDPLPGHGKKPSEMSTEEMQAWVRSRDPIGRPIRDASALKPLNPDGSAPAYSDEETNRMSHGQMTARIEQAANVLERQRAGGGAGGDGGASSAAEESSAPEPQPGQGESLGITAGSRSIHSLDEAVQNAETARTIAGSKADRAQQILDTHASGVSPNTADLDKHEIVGMFAGAHRDVMDDVARNLAYARDKHEPGSIGQRNALKAEASRLRGHADDLERAHPWSEADAAGDKNLRDWHRETAGHMAQMRAFADALESYHASLPELPKPKTEGKALPTVPAGRRGAGSQLAGKGRPAELLAPAGGRFSFGAPVS